MMEEQINFQYSIFRIPEIEDNTARHKIVIGLIDASGSMQGHWIQMAKFWNKAIAETCDCLITFSDNAKEVNPFLSDNINQYGARGTNIYAGFYSLQEKLETISEKSSVTVVFISDGEDNVPGTLQQRLGTLKGGKGKDITLICLGIQSGFPTRLSMKIRQLFHTGDEKIPALYLIEYASEKAFFNKFQTMSNYFKLSYPVRCLNKGGSVKEYPWQHDRKSKLKEGMWILVPHSIEEIHLIYNQSIKRSFNVLSIDSWQLDELVDCFRGWVQKIQLLSMNNEKMTETKQIAGFVFQLIKHYTNIYEKSHKLYILTQKPQGLKQSFKVRASSLAVKNIGSRIKWFLDELNVIAKGVGIGSLNEFDAAKRIGIGTITGKYHQKALALKGITSKDFLQIKKQFIKVFKKTTLSEKPSTQQVSIFTLQNQKEIFQQADFLDGLKMCVSQFDLVQSFPVVGYSLKVKRYDGSMINPWKVRVLQLATTHKSIDSVYLANNANKYELSIGQGNVEQINAVLPLFGKQDFQMSDLLNTRLFKLAVSFIVVQNIDTYHDEAYLALLASTFVFLLKEPDSEWKNNLIKLIHTSIKITYWQIKEFREFIQQSVQNPHILFTTKGVEDHIDITKVMLLVSFISKQKIASEEQLDHLIDLVMVHYTEKTYVQNKFKLSKVANIQINLQQQEAMMKKIQNLEKNIIKDHDHLNKVIDRRINSALDHNKIQIEFTQKIFTHLDEEKRVTYLHIKAFYQRLKKQDFNSFDFIYYFGHALKGKDEEAYRTPVSRNISKVKMQIFQKIDLKALGPNEGRKIKQLRRHIYDQYIYNFQKTHFNILPFTPSKFKEVCQSMKLNMKELVFNEDSGMVNNACMSPLCAHYLKPMNQTEFHNHMRLWKKTLPIRFHSTVADRLRQNSKIQQIYDYLIKSGEVNLQKHKKKKEEVFDYILLIKHALIQ